MQNFLVSLLTLAGLVSAVPSFGASFPKYGIVKRCEAVDVQFHFNDTTIGTTQGCTTDVMNRGTSTARLRRTDCVDGPSTNYTVIAGDTLEKIAAEYSSGVCNIASANGLTNPDFLSIGQVLIVPTDVCTADNDSCRTSAGTATCLSSGDSTYTIQSGDTFFLIAAELGITLDALVAANPDVDAGNLQVDQVIDVPICEA